MHQISVLKKETASDIEGSALELLRWAADAFGDRMALASSFGAEDVVLIDMLGAVVQQPRVFTLDTGRLPPETYQLIERIERRYGLRVEVHFPDRRQVEEMVRSHGVNLFRDSVDKRKECCRVRKVEPLQRALKGLSAWITGLRRQQSEFRSKVEVVEEGPEGLTKINPLAAWTESEVWDYIRAHKVPYNRLHDQNYPSIGCAPCTRAVSPGEDPRAGRWWWERSRKECGLHG